MFDIPNWAMRLILLLMAIRFPIALIVVWAFEITPEGIKRTHDVELIAATTVAMTSKHFVDELKRRSVYNPALLDR